MKLSIERIIVSKDNPRQNFDEEGLRQLGESIKSHGQLQPIIVRSRGSSYELVVGERRLRASVLVGLETIEAEVREVDDGTAMELRLIENTQREDLTYAEKGDAVLTLWANFDKYKTLKDIADAIQISYHTLANKWVPAATKLSAYIKEVTTRGDLTERAAQYLLKYPHSIQDKLANAIIKYRIHGGRDGLEREFLRLYDQNPTVDLEQLADKVKGLETVTVPTSMLSPELQKKIDEQKQLAKVQRIRKKPSKPITKEDVKEKLGVKAPFKFEKVKVSRGIKGFEPVSKAVIIPNMIPLEETPDYSLCKCAVCPLYAKHCKGRCWT